jgi:acyl-CoA reductase-like NAD-dependent aldehyde dehydrogenase
MPRLIEHADQIKQGPGMDPATEMGPLVSAEQFERVTGFLESGRKQGAKVQAGGGRPKRFDRGYFVAPTVFSDVKPDAKILREEIFGPVVCAIPFKDPEEVAKAGNDTTYGLAAAVWTADISKAHRMAEILKAGTVWINCYNMFDAASPFGGYKQSGFGREMGKAALELYTQIKSVWVNLGPH